MSLAPPVPRSPIFLVVVLLCFIDPKVRKIRNEASSCPGIFSRTHRFYYVASSSSSPLPHLLDRHRKLVGRGAIATRLKALPRASFEVRYPGFFKLGKYRVSSQILIEGMSWQVNQKNENLCLQLPRPTPRLFHFTPRLHCPTPKLPCTTLKILHPTPPDTPIASPDPQNASPDSQTALPDPPIALTDPLGNCLTWPAVHFACLFVCF